MNRYRVDSYSRANPFQAFIDTTQALDTMKANKMANALTKLNLQYKPQEYIDEATARKIANETGQTNLNYLAPFLGARNQGATIGNALQQLQLKYAPQEYQNQNAIQQLKLKMMQQEASQSQQPQFASPVGKAIADYQIIAQNYGEDSPQAQQAKQYIQKLNSIQSGLSVNSTPGGGFSITQGGVQYQPGVDQSQVGGQMQPGGQAGGMMVNPAAPGSQGGGRTVIDTSTGQSVSTLSPSTVSAAQQQMMAEAPLKNILSDIYQKVSPGLGTEGIIKRGIGQVGQFFGKEAPEFQDYQTAIQTSIPLVVDKMMTAFNLPTAKESIHMLETAVKPNKFDTPQSYKKRIATTMATLALQDKSNKAILNAGFSLGEKHKELPSVKELTDHYMNQLSGGNVTASGYGDYTASEINDYAKKSGMTPQQVIQKIQSLGGK